MSLLNFPATGLHRHIYTLQYKTTGRSSKVWQYRNALGLW